MHTIVISGHFGIIYSCVSTQTDPIRISEGRTQEHSTSKKLSIGSEEYIESLCATSEIF